MRIDRKTILAEYLGWDRAEVADYEYNPGRYGRTIVVQSGNRYYCVTLRGEQAPVTDTRGVSTGFSWHAVDTSAWPLPRYADRDVMIWIA